MLSLTLVLIFSTACIWYYLYTDDEITPYSSNPYGSPLDPASTDGILGSLGMTGEMEETTDMRPDVLSPHQYAMLMSSMQDPLALYSDSLGGSAPTSQLQQDHAPQPPPREDLDPLEMFSRQAYNISPPAYGHIVGVAGGHGQGGGEEEGSMPMYGMVRPTTTFQPRPPAAPRNQPSRR